MKTIKALGFGLLALSLLTGCAKKDDVSNQTALFWHNSIYKNITKYNLDLADDRFTSLEIEHPNSQFIPIDLLNLAIAHLYNEEFQLAEFYINEYEKRYANRYEKEWCEYQKAKIKFLSLTNAYTNQKKIDDTLKFVNTVLNNYPDSIYRFELNTIKRKLEDTKIVFNDEVSKLYTRLDKPKSAEIYKENVDKNIIPPHIPWYKSLFYW